MIRQRESTTDINKHPSLSQFSSVSSFRYLKNKIFHVLDNQLNRVPQFQECFLESGQICFQQNTQGVGLHKLQYKEVNYEQKLLQKQDRERTTYTTQERNDRDFLFVVSFLFQFHDRSMKIWRSSSRYWRQEKWKTNDECKMLDNHKCFSVPLPSF